MPLAADVWTYLAGHQDRGPVVGRMPDEAYRDDPPSYPPFMRFRPDRGVFLSTLARLPEVREPWLRAVHDRVRSQARAYPPVDPFW